MAYSIRYLPRAVRPLDEMFIYPSTQHGVHNNSTPRYNEAQAKIAWDRTMAFFRKHLV